MCYDCGLCSTSLAFGSEHLFRCFRPRRDLLLENLALRQQLTVLKRRHPKSKLCLFDKLFWVAARRFLARLEAISHSCHTGDRGPLASCWLSHVLEPDLQSENASG